MVEFSTILSFIQAGGIVVGVAYYILNIENNRRNQELAIKAQEHATETRELQFLLEQNKEIIETSYTNIDQFWKTMNITWTDFEDYVEKYGPAGDPESFLYRNRIWRRFHVTGLMLRDGMLDIETFVDYVGDTPILMWKKYKVIVEEFRTRFHLPSFLAGWEYLAEECDKYRIQQGWGPKTPDDMPHFNHNR